MRRYTKRDVLSESNSMNEVRGGWLVVLCVMWDWSASSGEGGGRCQLSCLVVGDARDPLRL